MRRVTRLALDDLEREIKYGQPVSETELDCLLVDADLDADLNLIASCILLRLPFEAVEERAGIMEFDGGASRVVACQQAVSAAIREKMPRISEQAAGAFFICASVLLDRELKNGWTRQQTADHLRDLIERQAEANRRRVNQGAAFAGRRTA